MAEALIPFIPKVDKPAPPQPAYSPPSETKVLLNANIGSRIYFSQNIQHASGDFISGYIIWSTDRIDYYSLGRKYLSESTNLLIQAGQQNVLNLYFRISGSFIYLDRYDSAPAKECSMTVQITAFF